MPSMTWSSGAKFNHLHDIMNKQKPPDQQHVVCIFRHKFHYKHLFLFHFAFNFSFVFCCWLTNSSHQITSQNVLTIQMAKLNDADAQRERCRWPNWTMQMAKNNKSGVAPIFPTCSVGDGFEYYVSQEIGWSLFRVFWVLSIEYYYW